MLSSGKERKDLENNTDTKVLQLVDAVKNNDTASFVELLGIFSKAISALASSYRLPCSEFDDLCQEGRMALYRAAVSYDSTKGASFFTYAQACMTNAMVSFVNKYNASASTLAVTDDEGGIVDVSTTRSTPEDEAFSIHLRELLSTRGFAGLSETERKTVFLKACGYKTGEISKKTGKSSKSVDNTLFRARIKLKNFMDGTK